MNRIYKIIRYFILADWQQKWNVIWIIFLTIKINLIVKYIPLKYYHRKYFLGGNDQIIDLNPFRNDIKLIRNILRNIPWKSTCLMESLIIKIYLLKRGITIPIFIGVRIREGLEAHAWYHDKNIEEFEKLDF